VDVLDAGIRGLAVVTVLVLSLFGYGEMRPSPDGLSVDPVVVASGLIVYNLLVVVFLGVPWRRAPGFLLFLLDWLVVSAAVLLTGGFFSPFLLLYYALVIGAALRVGLYRSLLLVAGCALVYAALSTGRPTPVDAVHLPVLAVGITSLLMVAVTAVFMKRALETEARRVEVEEHTARQLRLLNDLTRLVLSGSPNLESVMRSVAAVSSQALQADSGLVVLFETSSPGEDGHRDAPGAPSRLIVSDREPDPQRLSSHESRVAERAVRTQAPVLVEDRPGETPFPAAGRFPGLERDGQGVRNVACVPLLLRGGVIGALFVGRYAPRPFGETEVSLLTAIGQQMAVAVRLARLYDMERERASRSEERERLERDLLSMVSHELRTPLTSIKTCVSALNSIDEPASEVGRGGL
jgi:GAF domain/His Kinase A (phospho-acceptor) domain